MWPTLCEFESRAYQRFVAKDGANRILQPKPIQQRFRPGGKFHLLASSDVNLIGDRQRFFPPPQRELLSSESKHAERGGLRSSGNGIGKGRAGTEIPSGR